jgi:hypothetical protein
MYPPTRAVTVAPYLKRLQFLAEAAPDAAL